MMRALWGWLVILSFSFFVNECGSFGRMGIGNNFVFRLIVSKLRLGGAATAGESGEEGFPSRSLFFSFLE